MRFRLILLPIVAVLLASCGVSYLNWEFRHNIALFKTSGYAWQDYGAGTTGLKYEGYATLSQQLEQDASLHMWSNDELESRRALLSQFSRGGRLTVEIMRDNIDAANTEYFSVIVTDVTTGEELVRKTGDVSVPDYTVMEEGATVWSNLMLVDIPKKPEHDMKVYVVDDFAKQRFEWAETPEN